MIDDLESRYQVAIQQLLAYGHTVESPYGRTLERMGITLSFQAGQLVNRRLGNLNIGWMELLQLIAGVFDLHGFKQIAPNANHNLFTEAMAYGLRIRDQVPTLIDRLSNDPLTRRAVLYVGSRGDDMRETLTCTSTIQFLARAGVLNAIVSMRSWDAGKGLPADVIMFGGLTQMLARILGYSAGRVQVTAGSFHAYEADLPITTKYGPTHFLLGESVPSTWPAARDWALDQLVNEPLWSGQVPPWIDILEGTGSQYQQTEEQAYASRT